MKRSRNFVAIEIILFFLVLAGAYLLAGPAGKRVDMAIESAKNGLLERVYAETGLTLRYGSMSPSVFRSLRIRNMTLSDSGGAFTASFPDVEIDYGIADLLAGKGIAALHRVSVKGGSVTVNPSADPEFARRVLSLFSSAPTDPPGTPAETVMPDRLVIDLSSLRVAYSARDWSASCLVKKGTASFDPDGLRLSLDADARYRDARGKRGFIPSSATASVSLDGRFDPTLSSGTSSVSLRNLASDTVSTDSLRFAAAFRDGTIRLDSTQDLQPIDFNVSITPATSSMFGTFACEGLFPLRWLRFSGASPTFASLRDLELTGTGSFSYTPGTFAWKADLDSVLPRAFTGGGKLAASCSGTNDMLELDTLAYKGAHGELSGNLRFNLASWSADGILYARNFLVWRGTEITGDFYFQPALDGSACAVPSVTIGSASFTGLELGMKKSGENLELSLSALDSSGQFSVDGSLTLGEKAYLQLYGTFDTISVSNVIRTVYAITAPDLATEAEPAETTLEPIKATTEAYFSTDFRSLSFNCTRMVLASTEKDGQFMLLSANGTESSLSFTDIAVSVSGYTVNGNVGVDFAKGDVLFSSDFSVNSLPYRLNGLLAGRTLSFYGDYGFAFSMVTDTGGAISGGFSFENLPIPAGKALVSASLEAGFRYSAAEDWQITVERGHLEEVNGILPIATVADFTGTADANGVFLDTLTLSDSVSRLTGYAGLNRLAGADGATRYEGEAVFTSDADGESLRLNGNVTAGQDLYLDISGTFANLPLSRFLKNQGTENRVSGSFGLSGTPQTPFANVAIEDSSWRVAGFDLEARGRLTLDDRTCTLADASASWNGNSIRNLSGSVSLADFTANFTAAYQAVVGQSPLDAGLDVSFTSSSSGEGSLVARAARALDTCELRAGVRDIGWKTLKNEEGLTVLITRQPGLTELSAGSVTGFIADTGEFSLDSPRTNPVAFSASGKLDPEDLDVFVDGLAIDLPRLWKFTGQDSVSVTSGQISGNLGISGLMNDPDFAGELLGAGLVVHAPIVSAQDFGPFDLRLVADKKEFTISPVRIRAKKGSIDLSAIFTFERWLPTSFSVKTSVPRSDLVQLNVKNALFSASGFAGWDLTVNLEQGRLAVYGDAVYERGSIAITGSGGGAGQGGAAEPVSPIENLSLDLGIEIGNKVELRWPTDEFPIISGLLQADAPLQLSLDTASKRFSLKGSTNLKGGQIFYVKRNFYLRQGRIEFNENENIFDPIITARAEIRERDSAGDPVRIILSAENQRFSKFSPVLSSDPTKSEMELLALLGQAVTADTSRETLMRDTMITASDLVTQLSVFRQAENGVRDLLGLDLFSIRTLILQNAIFGPALKTNADTPMTIGNYFDNTTVYMGKYLGSAMYADALLHFSYYDPKSDQNTGKEQSLFGNMLFQPEFGLEVTTPFFLLRWGITPGFTPEDLRTLFVPDNAVTLSWKFSY